MTNKKINILFCLVDYRIRFSKNIAYQKYDAKLCYTLLVSIFVKILLADYVYKNLVIKQNRSVPGDIEQD